MKQAYAIVGASHLQNLFEHQQMRRNYLKRSFKFMSNFTEKIFDNLLKMLSRGLNFTSILFSFPSSVIPMLNSPSTTNPFSFNASTTSLIFLISVSSFSPKG